MLSQYTKDAVDRLTSWFFTPQWEARWEPYFRDTLSDLANDLGQERATLMDNAEHGGWAALLARALVDRFAELEFETAPLNATDDYLKRRGWKENRESREYLTAIKEAPFSIYEILSVQPGMGMTIQDRLRPLPPWDVCEVAASQQLHPAQHLFTKVVRVSGRYYLTGSGFVMRMGADLKRITEIRQAIQEQGLPMEEAYLPQINQIVRSYWSALLTDCVSYLLHPYPHLTNNEGHQILLADIRFPIKDKAALVQGLDNMPDFHRQNSVDEPSWNWMMPPEARQKGASSNQELQFVRAGLIATEQGLQCFANSKERAEMLIAHLQETLPDVLGQPLIAYQAPESLRSQPGKRKAPGSSLPPDVEKELIHSHLDRHYRSLLDSPIPMLNDLSPREAAQSPEGQALVQKWLLYLESQNARRTTGAMEGYSFEWLRTELGVPKPS